MDSNNFSVQILPLVVDYQLQSQNISLIRLFYNKEVDLESYFDSFKKPKHIPDFLLKQVEQLNQTKTKQTESLVDFYIKALHNQSINPTLEIIAILDNLTSKTPKNCAIVISKYKEIILGSVCIFIDPRTTLYSKKVGFFIGIRKSTALIVAQKLNPHIWNEYRLSKELIPAMEKYALQKSAKALSTIPFTNMANILRKHYKFSKMQPNQVKSDYEPACFICNFPEEVMVYKMIE